MEWLLLIIIIPYLCYILSIRIYLSRIKPYTKKKTDPFFISVIIACRNEEERLPSLLESLSKQDYPSGSFEVIIVDDNSTDNTFFTSSRYDKIKNLRILKNTGSGKKAAIRTGVAAASGELIITTDADCTMTGGWIGSIASFYVDKIPDMIICPVKLKGGKGFFQHFQELEFLSLQGITAGTVASGNPVMCNGANMVFTRETFNQNSDSLHDEIPSGDDVFLLHAVKSHGDRKIMWLESVDSIVTTGTVPSLKAFLRQRTRWISKAGAYTDMHTRVLGTVTFFAVLLQGILLPASIFEVRLVPVFVAVFMLKSIPDFLVLENTTKRYGSTRLLGWFLPSQLVYPYYILVVVFLQAFKSLKRERQG